MVLVLEKDSATTVDAMAIPLPPWLTREYDYASGIRRTGEVIARNLQRRRELEIEAVRAAAAAQQAQALEQYRQAQAAELQRKSELEAQERSALQERMNEFRRRVASGADPGRSAMELDVLPPGSLGTVIASQEATRRAAEEAARPRSKTAAEIQREDIMRLWRAAQEPDEMVPFSVPAPFGAAPAMIPRPSQAKEAAKVELDIAKRQAGIRDEVEGALTQQQRAELQSLNTRQRSLLSQLSKAGKLSPDQMAELTRIQNRQSELFGQPVDEIVPVVAPQTEASKSVQKSLPLAKKPYFDRPKTIP